MTLDAWRIAPLMVLLLAGCATQPADEAAQAAAKGDKDTASQLYGGEPSVVHATEFPVESAADGIRRGDEAWRAGKLDLAIYLYVQSLAFDATQADPFLRIGAVHEQRVQPRVQTRQGSRSQATIGATERPREERPQAEID